MSVAHSDCYKHSVTANKKSASFKKSQWEGWQWHLPSYRDCQAIPWPHNCVLGLLKCASHWECQRSNSQRWSHLVSVGLHILTIDGDQEQRWIFSRKMEQLWIEKRNFEQKIAEQMSSYISFWQSNFSSFIYVLLKMDLLVFLQNILPWPGGPRLPGQRSRRWRRCSPAERKTKYLAASLS